MKLTLLALATAGLLSFCDTAEERAERHFQSGLALLEAGDVDRALVEFRNVFKLDGQHREARLQYAEAERARGNTREAFGHYLRLVEQYPDSLIGQRALAELALEINDWEAARRHASAATNLAPEDPLVRAIAAAVSYRDGISSGDNAVQQEAVIKAQALVEEAPDLMAAQRVVIDNLVRKQDWAGALVAIDAALAEAPNAQDLYTARLGVLNQLGETRAIQAQLEDMITRFPDDPTIPSTLVRWYMSQGQTAAAQDFLKQRTEQEPRDVGDIVEYIRFLTDVHGIETARAELDEILSDNPPGKNQLAALRASFRFEMGDREGAVAEMEGLIEASEPSDERRSIMVMLARMLEAMDNKVGARSLVEQVLEEDSGQADAMKMRAAWLTDSDNPDEAIVTLREVLGQSPNDAQAITLMAIAHERAGNRELMAEMLARAVEVSRNAPEESLRYARHLIAEDSLRTAESVLINSLRISPENISLLSSLGEVYMREQDWSRMTQLIETLDRLESAEATRISQALTARQLAAQDREEELMSFLGTIADDENSGMGAAVEIVRTHMAKGDTEEALQYARQMLEANPDDRNTRLLLASVQAATGDAKSAEAAVRELATENPGESRFWLALHNIYAAQEENEAARQAVTDGLAKSPMDPQLNWTLASIMERDGEIAGAIDIYEKLYEENSSNLVIANNLASLLATADEDPESLARAHKIALRLRGRDVPAFQDTYGWIAFRRGDLDSALTALEPAAAGLPADPLVQYHLARTYAALDRTEDALAQYRKVVEVVGANLRPDYMDEVEAEIGRLSVPSE
jgi:tetratricopeptide (TPR) repeat protein